MTDLLTIPSTSIDALCSAVRGPVITPGDDAYDDARGVWNAHIDRRPALIARCTGTADVIAGIRFAGEHDLPVAVRGGGHSFAGFGTCDGGLVLDLGAMNGVRVDLVAQRATVQGGATWGDLDHEGAAFGLATTGGLISTTGVGGLTLGGGIGWLMRKYGMACDNVAAADVVTASGELIHATADEHPDLFWALRGGGGNFGVVTALEYRLHPVATVLGGALLFAADRTADVFARYAELAATEPDELCTLLEIATAPDADGVEPAYRGRPIIALALCYCGPIADGEAAIAPWRRLAPVVADFVEPMSYTAMQTFFDGDYPKGLWSYMKAHYLHDLTPAGIDALVDASADRPLGRSIIDVHHLGGAAARVPPGDTAFDQRDAGYAVLFGAISDGKAGFDEEVAWGRRHWTALAPHATGGAYENFNADRDTAAVRSAWTDATRARLQAVKRQYDPHNRFRFNHNIEPEPAAQ